MSKKIRSPHVCACDVLSNAMGSIARSKESEVVVDEHGTKSVDISLHLATAKCLVWKDAYSCRPTSYQGIGTCTLSPPIIEDRVRRTSTVAIGLYLPFSLRLFLGGD